MSELRIGVVGAMGRGAYLSMIFNQHPDCRVVAVADVNPASFEFHKERFEAGGCVFNRYSSATEMLAQEEFDWLFVATPDRTHHALTVEGLKAGRHVFVEKPMCQSMAHADEICHTAEEMGKHVVVGYEFRYAQPAVEMRRLIQAGAIGRMIHGYCIDSIAYGYSYFLRNFKHRALGVGTLMQKGSHSLDLILSMVDSEPRKVYASGGRAYFGQNPEYTGRHCRDCDEKETCKFSGYTIPTWKGEFFPKGPNSRDQCVYDPNTDVEDNVALLVDFDNGVRLTYSEIDFDPDYKREFTFVGTEGKISLTMGAEEGDQGIIRLRRRHQPAEIINSGFTEGNHFGADELMRDELVAAGLRGEGMRPTAREGRAALSIVMAALDSMQTGLPSVIPVYQPALLPVA